MLEMSSNLAGSWPHSWTRCAHCCYPPGKCRLEQRQQRCSPHSLASLGRTSLVRVLLQVSYLCYLRFRFLHPVPPFRLLLASRFLETLKRFLHQKNLLEEGFVEAFCLIRSFEMLFAGVARLTRWTVPSHCWSRICFCWAPDNKS